MNISYKEWEQLLQQDDNPRFLEKRDKYSDRFWKKRLFELFEEAHTKIQESNSNQKFKFVVGWIVNSLKADKNILYFKSKETVVNIASLFGKYIYVFRDKTSARIHKELQQPLSVEETPTLHKYTQFIQLSLFDELDMRDDKKVWENKELLQQDDNVPLPEQESVQKSDIVTADGIDLDALYAPDPDEPRWNK